MVRIYEQVDQAAIDGSIEACDTISPTDTEYNRELEESGTLGSGTNVISINSNDAQRGFHFESEANEPNSTSWPAGTWTSRINVTTGNANVLWDSWYICRLNSGGASQATIAARLSIDIVLTAGVKLNNHTGSADSGASATDRFYIVGVIQRDSGAHGSQAVTITNDQLIDTPFAALAAANTVSSYQYPVRGIY